MMRERNTHIWEADEFGHYPEPLWCSARLFEVEDFGAPGARILDPCSGWGHIPHNAVAAGYTAIGNDIVDRRDEPWSLNSFNFVCSDFLKDPSAAGPAWSAVFNPPFDGDHIKEFVERALAVVEYKVAALVPIRRLPAAHWVEALPLETIWILTPRPSLPPASYIRAGEKPGGGGQDFGWLIFNKKMTPGAATRVKWLHRDARQPVAPRGELASNGGAGTLKTATAPAMHSPFGGSAAARVLHCPASVRLVEQVPTELRKVSAYAERGTALHVAMARLLDDLDANTRSLESLVGETFNNYTITRDDVENALAPVFAYVNKLLAPGAEYYLERRVIFPTIANTFGTCDLLARIGNVVHVLDFKFGEGVRVRALYPDGDDDVLNAQLMFYAAAARHSHRPFFAGSDTIVLTILQPVSIEPDADMESSVTVTLAELDGFIEVYRAACAQALSPAPPLARGDWCQFCPARPICPEHTGPLLDLAKFAMPAPSPGGKSAYLQALADGLRLVDAVKDIGVALRDQAKRALDNGDAVPGYMLSAGRAERHWHDESAAITTLLELGLARDDIVAEAMRSPRQLELKAKARGLKIPQDLIGSHRSGTSLVRSESARAPVPGRGEIVQSFSAALKALEGVG
jgi:hypothetical protein